MSKGNRIRQARQNPELFIQQQQFRAEITSSPLPPPEILQGYNSVDPGFANRIFEMAEREQRHRHETEGKIVKSHFGTVHLGQIFGFLIGITAIVSGVYLVLKDKQVSGFGIFFSGLAALVGAFIYSQKVNAPTPPAEP